MKRRDDARKWAAVLLSGAGILSLPTGALAQDVGAPVRTQDRPAGANSAVDTIIVTARKREEDAQDVPASVAAVSDEQLDGQSIDQVLDLTNKLPNFIIPNGAPNSVTDLSVRGVNVGVRNAGFNPSVSFYVDGVYQGRPANFNQALLDVERVELLLGPQGTLFGNNTIAGVVNIITKTPGDQFGGYVRATAGNFDLREVQGTINVPAGEDVSTSLSLQLQNREGYQQNFATGQDQGNLSRGSGRFQVLAEKGDTTVRFVTSVQSGRERAAVPEYIEARTSQFSVPLGLNPPFVTDFAAAPNPHEFFQNPSTSKFERADANVSIEHELTPSLTLVSISGYKHTIADDKFDNDSVADQRVRADIFNLEKQMLLSQEVRLESDPTKRFSFVLGGYYLDDTLNLTRTFSFPPPFVVLGGLGALDLAIDSYSRLETQTISVFGNVQYDILENLEASVGLRYSDEEQKTIYDQIEVFRIPGQRTNQFLPLGPTGGLLVANAPRYTDERTDGLVSGTATLSYKFDEDRMIYGRFARGTKSGGFNLEPLPNPLPLDRSFNAEELDSYEVGVKTQWFDDRFRFNLTGFFQDYRDLQRADVIPIQIAPGVTGFTRTIRNAAAVEVKGFETSAELVPLPGLTLSGAYGQAEAVFVEYQINSGANLNGQSLSGVPEWNATLGADYERELSSGFSVSGGLSAEIRGEAKLGEADAIAKGVSGYHVLNAYLALSAPEDRWQLSLFGNNITDEVYVTTRGNGTDFFAGADRVGFGLPRMYGASLKVLFGNP